MVLSAQDILKTYTFLYRGALNMPAYAASVERSDYNPAVLDEMGVSARVSDFKQRMNRRPAPPPPELEPIRRVDPPAQSAKSTKQAKTPAPTRRTERLPGELKQRKPAETAMPVPSAAVAQPKKAEPAPAPAMSDECRRVWDRIPEDRAVSSDALMAAGIPPASLTVALTQLELEGLIEALPGNLYIRTSTI